MTRTGIAILGACGVFMGWILLSLLLLLYGNDWWLSGLTTLTVFAWLAGLLAVMFQQGRIRVAATGAVIAAAAYWLVALGPWFSANVGPTLLTSRLLASVDVMLHGNNQPAHAITWTYPPTQPAYINSGPGIYTSNTLQAAFLPQTYTLVTNAAASPGGTVFQSLGQWLLIWLCAGIGGCAALLMQVQLEKKQPRAVPAVVGESPFAPPAPDAPAPPVDAQDKTEGAAS
jgi:hypothetical protein